MKRKAISVVQKKKISKDACNKNLKKQEIQEVTTIEEVVI
jgi:hypothetical protein